jgi:hypothetical protein
MEALVQNFVRQQNIKLLEEALEKEVDPDKRRVLEGLLAKQNENPAQPEESPPS